MFCAFPLPLFSDDALRMLTLVAGDLIGPALWVEWRDRLKRMRPETAVSLSDFQFVSIECPGCNTRVVLDMKEKSALAEKHGFFAPKECPGCRSQYDSATRETVDAMQKVYEQLLKVEGVTFYGQ